MPAAGGPPMMGGGAGPLMMFVSLLPEHAPDKAAWTKKDIEPLTRKWRAVGTVWNLRGGERGNMQGDFDVHD